ncbi:hypothetical protein SDC9_183711 [bioreactor metagenome]|uniref:Uncharacterized protein n=1 Tax=bioreactor metagenome TaxID=1076179 RepID=A0A645HKR3_9ZZZZ
METYGARSGGQIADYLSHDDQETAAQELLKTLTKTSEKKEETPAPAPASEAAPAIDTSKLDVLSDETLKPKAEEPKPVAKEPEVDYSEANEKLKNILSGSKKE